MSAAPGMQSEQQAQAYVDELMEQARTQVVRARAMADELESLAVRGRSGDGRCEVTVGHGGGLVDLWLSPGLAQGTLDEIRRGVLEANAAARRTMSEEAAALAAAHYGAGSATAEELTSRLTELLAPGAAPGAHEESVGQPRRTGVVR
ncbi:YbaB/EbfC family nucleoid-associated protein [Nocardioides pacificus]